MAGDSTEDESHIQGSVIQRLQTIRPQDALVRIRHDLSQETNRSENGAITRIAPTIVHTEKRINPASLSILRDGVDDN